VRDGKPFAPTRIDDLHVLPGVEDALVRLRRAGFQLIVVTNQPDVARGAAQREAIETMHEGLAAMLPIDEFRVCYHDDRDECTCRKPKAGLLEAAAADLGVNLGSSFMVGDRWRDIEAGRRVGCTTVFVDWGYDERRPTDPDLTVASLAEAVEWIVSRQEETQS
jgi:D-glycero-D-manno-heptose 1,7-bisphosphate phosphatase